MTFASEYIIIIQVMAGALIGAPVLSNCSRCPCGGAGRMIMNTDQQDLSLDRIRGEIDEIDRQMRSLFVRRMELADQVARVKAKTEDKIYKPDRESAILEKQSEGLDEKILMEYKAFLRRNMEVSRKYQYGRTLELRNCFPYPFTTAMPPEGVCAMLREEIYACDFSSRDSILAAADYEEIVRFMKDGKCRYGAGIADEVGSGVSDPLHRTLTENHLYINRCRVVDDHFGKHKVVVFSDTLYVEDDHNRLRLVFTAPNRSGALGSILSMIADYGVNLTEIHSFPFQTDNAWNYRFFTELELNLQQASSKALIFQLSQETQSMQLLGSYHCEGDF